MNSFVYSDFSMDVGFIALLLELWTGFYMYTWQLQYHFTKCSKAVGSLKSSGWVFAVDASFINLGNCELFEVHLIIQFALVSPQHCLYWSSYCESSILKRFFYDLSLWSAGGAFVCFSPLLLFVMSFPVGLGLSPYSN